MPAQLEAYVAHAFGMLPRQVAASGGDETALGRVFDLLRTRTDHDFSKYKPSTTGRRIARRMAIHQISTLEDYAAYAEHSPGEIESLFRDLLISVTGFFREPATFEVLEAEAIPAILAGKPAGGSVRVWSPGCATGEEPYSLAMLFAEQERIQRQDLTLQIFATDIDTQALATARAGLYPASSLSDVSPERLERFFLFEPESGSYRVKKGLRDMLLFSEQDLIRDPPFSKVDLISCRNLLIYLSDELQKKLLPLFHYALNPDGFLFLGASESVGEFGNMFASVNRKARLFRCRKEVTVDGQTRSRAVFPLATATAFIQAPPAGKASGGKESPLRRLTEQALLEQATPAALVNSRGDILYIHGSTGAFLEPAPGEITAANIVKMARESLRSGLTLALYKAVASGETVRRSDLQVKADADTFPVELAIHRVADDPAAAQKDALYLVTFTRLAPTASSQAEAGPRHLREATRESEDTLDSSRAADAEARVLALQDELRAREEHLETALEELETTNDELRSTVEEIQSVNEELQSTNEELETSKEELQSVNEELATVNTELQAKVADLSLANADMNNLLAGTGVGTVYVDMELRLLRFTPAAAQVVNLINTDVGRPVAHISSNLVNYDSLVADLRKVLDTLEPIETQVLTSSGRWYLMHIRPYQTLDNVIEGAVVTFVDITEHKVMEESLRDSKFRTTEAAVNTVHEPFLVLDSDFHVLLANAAFFETFRVTSESVVGTPLFELGGREWDIPELRRLLEDILPHDSVVSDFEVSRDFGQIGWRKMSLSARRIVEGERKSEMIFLAITDISGQARSGGNAQ
jgi:two-component system, chemotaxis family, CheB/CheR fusion protein